MSVERILAEGRQLIRHATACRTCAAPVAVLIAVPDDPRRTEGAVHEALCTDGRELFTSWWAAKQDWLATTEELRQRQFITTSQIFDDGVSFEQRASAIMSMPGVAYSAWLALPDDQRRNQLRSLEVAGRRLAGQPGPTPAAPMDSSTARERRPGPWRRPGGGRATLESTE